MVFAFVLRALENVVAYVCPAYLTYKALEYSNDKERQKWIVYWCILAWFSAMEFICDFVLFWIPFYSLGKITFVIYLWHPKTKGAEMIYREFLVPYLRQNEAKIDKTSAAWTLWISEKYVEGKERALTALGRSAVAVLEKAQEIGTPKSNREQDTPTHRILRDRTLSAEQKFN
eukprot:g8951.t1